MTKKETKSKKNLKKWKREKEQIIITEDWTIDSLLASIRDLRANYLKMTSNVALSKCFKTKKKQKEFTIQINEVLSCLWYCQELHLFYLLFPNDVKERTTYISSTISKYKQYIADHHYLYLKQKVAEHLEIDYPTSNFEEIMRQDFLIIDTITYAKARFYAIDLLIAYLNNQSQYLSNQNRATTASTKIQWSRPKIDLSVLVVALTKIGCFNSHLGKPISATQLAGYFEQFIDIEIKKDIHQTVNNVFKRKEDKSIFKDLSYWYYNKEEN